jgi:anti-sigma factor RsiW
MSMERDTPRAPDEELTAYLDGELPAEERAAMEARLAADTVLRTRLESLRAARPPVAPFDLLLDIAPVDRLDAMIEAAEPRPAPLGRRRFGSFAAIAAALVLLALGAAVGFGVGRSTAPIEIAETSGWRAVVADYVALYTPETFALAPSDPEAYAPRLKIVGDRLGLDLAPEKVALPGLDLKGAILFEYDGKPLGQISYLSQENGPVAFCIIANGRDDTPPAFEERRGRNIVFWNSGGHGYLIIGAVPRERLESLAETLASRVS